MSFKELPVELKELIVNYVREHPICKKLRDEKKRLRERFPTDGCVADDTVKPYYHWHDDIAHIRIFYHEVDNLDGYCVLCGENVSEIVARRCHCLD